MQRCDDWAIIAILEVKKIVVVAGVIGQTGISASLQLNDLFE